MPLIMKTFYFKKRASCSDRFMKPTIDIFALELFLFSDKPLAVC